MDDKISEIRDKLTGFFAEDGLLAGVFDNYEHRPQQLQMANAVLDSIAYNNHTLIEAPTGIGKSFAYLVPSLLFAKEFSRKAVISTYTINLQEQLIDKDIPLLKRTLGIDFNAGILKGRKNYLCTNRLSKAMESSNTLFESEEKSNLNRIIEWSRQTADGTLSDIRFEVIPEVWDSVCSERGICTQKTCGGEHSNCFYQKALAELELCELIILNHHLFFSLYDGVTEGKNGYLYLNDFLIFDEAHTVENVASEHIAPEVSRDLIKYNLLRLSNSRKKKGFLLELPSLHVQMKVQNLLDMNQSFFYGIRRELFENKADSSQSLARRIYEVDTIENELHTELGELIIDLRALRPACRSESQENELNEFILRFSEIRAALDDFFTMKKNTPENEFVYWVEIASSRPDANVKLCSSPVSLADYFRINIFKPENSAVLTSATLTTARSFDYFRNRLGADSTANLLLDSPFDYSRQVKIYIPEDMPPPAYDSQDHYRQCLIDWIRYFIGMTKGKALVLFTNRKLLKEAGAELKDFCSAESISLLLHDNTASRKNLLENFKTDVNSVLFGLDSFWMGIDVPGESLSNLIITKLPFQVPNHPLIQARIEHIEKCGGNSFADYSLPEAILKFRQGIGRLIRSKEDKGIIVILDNRIIRKSYGRNFLDSIEECPVELLNSRDVLQRM